ncbi:MAG: hypothetical protein ISP90_11495 [Nevskia sp.]|nr:hypothetical protein [Nevskia sp.]
MSRDDRLKRFVQGSLRAEKARRGLTFEQLSRALAEQGIRQSATNLSTKVGRGDMSARLFLALMKVLGCQRIDLRELDIRQAGTPPRK